MKKFILILFSTFFFLFPQSTSLAQDPCREGTQLLCPDLTEPNLSGYCDLPNNTSIPAICRDPNGTPAQLPGTQPPPATTAIEAAQNANSQLNPPTLPCQGCASGNGLQCNTSNGEPTTSKGDGTLTAIGCIPNEPIRLVNGLLRYGTFASGGVAFLLMILAAIQMITAEGNPQSIKTAQERFYSAIIGLLLIIFSVLLLQVIGFDLLGLKGFGR